jgi:hypothetical protein
MLNVMKAYGNARPTRDEYLAFIYAGNPPINEDGQLPAELEADLPEHLQLVDSDGRRQWPQGWVKRCVTALRSICHHLVTEGEQ